MPQACRALPSTRCRRSLPSRRFSIAGCCASCRIRPPAMCRKSSVRSISPMHRSPSLPKKLTEVAIPRTGRRWNSQLEFHIHSEAAIAAGLDPACIEAIRLAQAPAFADEAEIEVYEFARMLQQTGGVDARLHGA